MLTIKLFINFSSFIVLSVASVLCFYSSANAVTLNEAGLPSCYLPKQDSSSAVGSIGLDFYLCEDFNFFSAIFVGDFVDQGESVTFDWQGTFWGGSVKLAYSLDVDNDRQVLASGSGQHLVPDLALRWEFEDLIGGGTGDVTKETSRFISGAVEHDDFYTALFRLNEGRALYNVDSNPMPFERGFILEVKGRHGNGPFCIQYAPGGKQCVDMLAPDFFLVPTPSSLSLMVIGLFGVCLIRKRLLKPIKIY